MLQERLAQLEEAESGRVDTNKTPSEGQVYFYRSRATLFEDSPGATATSLIRVEQDAAFVATDLYVIGSTITTEFATPFFSEGFTGTPFVKFVCTSSGRNLSVSSGKQVFPERLFDFGVPYECLIPLYREQNPQSAAALDYHYKLPCEYLLPRGATLEALAVFTRLGSGDLNFNIGIDFVLGGYKVFGA